MSTEPVVPARKEGLSKAAMVSVAMHAAVVVLAIVPMGFMHASRPHFGDPGPDGRGAVPVTLEGSIPLPRAPIENKIATDTKPSNLPEKIEKTAPKAKAPEPPPHPDDYTIPSKKTRQEQAKKELLAELKLDQKQASNAIPGSGGGASTVLYGQPPSATGSGTNMSFGGDFGSRYGFYVRSVHDCISHHWDRTRIDAVIRTAPKAFVDFSILRDGTISGERVITGSGVPSVDREAIRSIQACSGRAGSEAHLPPLPRDFEGSSISVEVSFEPPK